MEYILTPEQMRNADKKAIEYFKIPSVILMENAARSSFQVIRDICDRMTLNKILIICGNGNNGGDGFAIARLLSDYYQVTLWWYGNPDKMTDETRINFESCKHLNILMVNIKDSKHLGELDLGYEVIIDSMIGVGGSENIKGLAYDILKLIHNHQAVKIAIDVPTGLNSATGRASDVCFRADYTITMFAKKTGMLINEGRDYCGQIFTAFLGAPLSCVESQSNTYVFQDKDRARLLPKRNCKTSKFDYGRLAILAGSNQYPGAAALASNAAIKSGVGLVELFTENIHPALLPEVIVRQNVFSDDYWNNNYDLILNDFLKSDAVLIGPGLGYENLKYATQLFTDILGKVTIVLDADAIQLLDIYRKYPDNLVITPHTGEFAKLTGIDRLDVENNTFELAKEYSSKLGCIIHLKHNPSITAKGKSTYLTINGNPGMATAGSGDVLSGIAAAFCAAGLEPFKSTGFAAFIHAKCGDEYKNKYGEISLTASNILLQLNSVLH